MERLPKVRIPHDPAGNKLISCLAYAVKALKEMHERKEIEGRAAGSTPSSLTLNDTRLTLLRRQTNGLSRHPASRRQRPKRHRMQ